MDPNVLKNVLGSSVTIKPIAFLYLPGAVFILASLMTFRLHRMSTPAMLRSVNQSLRMVGNSSVALLFSVPMVQVFIHSGDGASGLDSMPNVLAGVVAEMAGSLWPAFASMLGGVGGFCCGFQHDQQYDVLTVSVRSRSAGWSGADVGGGFTSGRWSGRKRHLRS